MKPEAQRIAIAEACGWSVIRLSCGFYAKHKTEGRISISAASACATQNEAMCDRVPDYINDLNAMHEAEKMLTDEQDLEYSESLEQVVGARFNSNNGEDMRRLRSATAAQRAEAFLRTLGKWEEGA